MSKKLLHDEKTTKLRKRAEEAIEKYRDITHAPVPDSIWELIHELNVHQVELEIQNEELRRAQDIITEAHHKYSDLYDFAPVGYLTTDKAGLITQANLTMSALLLLDKSRLLGKPLHSFVAPVDQDVYYLHRKKVLESRVQQTCEVSFRRADSTRFWGRIESVVRIEDGDENIQIRSVVTDVTDAKKAQQDRETYLHDLGERNKELTCIYNVAKSILDRNTTAEILQDVADLIPPGWQYPEITRAKVLFRGNEYVSEPFEETQWCQAGDIVVNGNRCGSVEVYYLQECPELDEGPFMAEERDLVDGIARALSSGIERKTAQEQIEYLAKFPSEDPSPVLRIARDGTLLYANQASESLLRECNCQVGQAVPEHWRQRVSQALESGAEKQVETEHEDRIFSFAIAPVEEAGYANLYGRDITARKKAEEETLRYANIASSSSEMMAALDANFVYLSANDAYLQAIGRTKDQVIGHTPSDVFGEEFFKTTVYPNAQECLQGQRVTYESWLDLPAAGKRFLLATYSPHTGLNGQITGFIVNAKDITDRQKSQQELERLMNMVEAKNKELQDIVYIASHDLNSPLVNILGFSGELLKDLERLESLARKDKQDQSVRTAIENLLHTEIPQEVNFISAAANMLKGLIDGMLEVSRIGNAKYTIEPLNMDEIIKQVVGGLDFTIRDIGASVSVEHLPDCLGDVAKTSQLFGNLIGNALKYLDPERKGDIRISGRTEDGRSEYCVQDNGIGIEPRNQPKVFEIFHRLNPDGNKTGEGLGLTIAVRILDQMDGSIRLESEHGKGSNFFVSLPSA